MNRLIAMNEWSESDWYYYYRKHWPSISHWLQQYSHLSQTINYLLKYIQLNYKFNQIYNSSKALQPLFGRRKSFWLNLTQIWELKTDSNDFSNKENSNSNSKVCLNLEHISGLYTTLYWLSDERDRIFGFTAVKTTAESLLAGNSGQVTREVAMSSLTFVIISLFYLLFFVKIL